MESPPPYIYSHLAGDSIRLLGLSTPSDCLSGTLKSVKLNDTPPYFALSYAWDKQTQNVPLQVDGQVLSVSPSLRDAIRRLQWLTTEDAALDTPVKWVWIDRICINQEDFSERSRQVQLMSSIYSQAIKTLIWLGPDFESCSAAWQLIDQIYILLQRENPGATVAADIPFQMYSDRNHEATGLPAWDDELWRHLRKLFELPWFTRSWIIQEVAVSRDDPIILHGQHRYQWHRLGWASSWLRRNGYLRLAQIPNQMQNVDTIFNIGRSGTRWRLDALLVATSIKCHATDQRDKVYALLGLAAENHCLPSVPDALRANYELEVAQVYTRVALFLVREYKTLSVLTRASGVSGDASQALRKYKFERLPSWVPNWCDFAVMERDVAKSLSWLFPPNNANAATLGFPEHYNASSRLPAKVFESPDQSVLRLSGLKADIVVSSTQFADKLWPSGGHAREYAFQRLWKATLPFLPESKSLTAWIASWIKATTAEQYLLSGSSAEQILKDGSAYLLDILSRHEHQQIGSTTQGGGQDIIGLLRELSMGGDPESYSSLASNFCLNRRFIITSKGCIGIGPEETQSGDLVSVIFGGGVPYILRKQETGFVFVGESYIHGLMSGEAVQAWQRGDLAEEILELR
ncbi:HET domain-containing protein [Cadophora sp. DSE1049]|nr:HET domain-containing protein [Cadophora sp. DSE1049]